MILKDNEWIKATPLDIRDLGDLITNQIEIPRERLANIVGFIIEFKNEQYVYKTLDLEQNKSGARCDQSGKAAVIKTLNKIFEDNKYNKETLGRENNVLQLCSEQEMYLRYFDKIKKFFDTMPRLRHEQEVTNPKTGVKSTVTFSGLQDFFGLASPTIA